VAAEDVTVSPEIDQGLPLVAGFLLAVVGLVLLLACTNLASFLLAQGINRRKEVAVRLAMGAPRKRLVRQLLSETILLGLLGGCAGLLVASWTLGLLLGVLPQLPAPLHLDLGLDGTVLLFTLLVSMAAGVFFGLAPALQSTRPDITPTLKDAGPIPGRGKFKLRSTLVAVQMAVSVVLLVGGGLFVRAFYVAENIDPGFSTRGIGTAWIDLAMSGIPREGWGATETLLRERLRAEPGIQSVGSASQLPLALGSSFQLFTIPGVEAPPGEGGHLIYYAQVSPGFFETLDVPILSGRGLNEQDRAGTPDVAVVSEAMAEAYWPGQDPLGKQILRGSAERAATVVGVARDTKVVRLGESPRPFIYLASAQYPTSALRVVARGSSDISAVLTTLRRTIREVNPDFAIMEVRSMEDHVALLLFPSKVAALLLGVFGGLALLLSAVGLYGVVDYSVSSRTREVGIRMSLGARGRDVMAAMVRGTLVWVAVGGVVGLAGAYALARIVQGFLFGVGAGDPLTMVLVPLLLGAVASAAALVPARRAVSVNPVEAIRTE
jgi:predicted permease